MTQIVWTEIPDKYGTTMTAHSGTWSDLTTRLRTVGTFPNKNSCPWFKGASFGDKRSPGNSLRHDANVLAIHAVEGDYDAKPDKNGNLVTIEKAQAMLEKAGIRAALYPSPSSTPETPRWRVIAPLAAPYQPGARSALVARLNGALGGILANESFTLSQGYFFGATPTNDYRVVLTFDDPDEGTCVDDLDDLDNIAIGKHSAENSAQPNEGDHPKLDRPKGENLFADRVAQLGRLLVEGDGRRDMLKTYIASRSARGLSAGELHDVVRGIVDRYFDGPMDETNIDAIIQWATGRDALKSLSNFRDDDQTPPFQRVSIADVISNPPAPQEYIWGQYIPKGVLTLQSAHGGTGKSLMNLQLAAHYAVNRDFLGLPIKKCGKALFFSAEDATDMVRLRFAQICQADGLDPVEVDKNLIVLDATDAPALYQEDEYGRKGERTQAYYQLAQMIDAEGVDFVVIDNASDTFDADPINRRRVGEFIRWLVQMVKARNGTVLLLAHVNRQTAQGHKSNDQDFADSAAWHNKARSRLFLFADPNDRAMLTLRHQKANLSLLQPELQLAMRDSGGVTLRANIDLSDFFEVTSDGVDARVVAIVSILADFNARGEDVSTATKGAHNCAFKALGREPNFPKGIKKAEELTDLMRQAERLNLIERETFKKNGKSYDRWRVVSPSSPSSPSSYEGVGICEGGREGGTPSPSCLGGMGEGECIDEGEKVAPDVIKTAAKRTRKPSMKANKGAAIGRAAPQRNSPNSRDQKT
jgi:hypothetical protein